MDDSDLAEHARALLAANSYLTLGTTGADGRPWTTPVYFAAADTRNYYWISEIETLHSRNLTERPHVSLVVFDSTVTPYHGRAVYAAGSAREVTGDAVDAGLTVYPGRTDRGVPSMTRKPSEVSEGGSAFCSHDQIRTGATALRGQTGLC